MHVAVAGPSTLSADAGAAIARAGGNAVDATIASMLVAMTTEPGVCGLGGGGFISVWPRDGDPVTIDAYAAMPGKGRPPGAPFQMWDAEFDYGGRLVTRVGHGSVAVPGALAGLSVAAERFGTLPWKVLCEPIIDIAERGFPLPVASRYYLEGAGDVIYGWHQESYRAFHQGDRLLDAGENIVIEGFADAMRHIAEKGAESLYTGEFAQLLVSEMEAGGGRITAEDLATYEVFIRQPYIENVNGWHMATNPGPAVGGATLLALIHLLEEPPLGEWTAEALARFAHIQQFVLGYRRENLDAAPDRTEAVMRLIGMLDEKTLRAALGSPSTVHISAADMSGNVCSSTMSAGYGSGLTIPGTGLWLNNSLGEIELNPAALDPQPGDRLLSNMAPTVARKDTGSTLAIGSPGADRITTALAMTIANVILRDMPLQAAVDHPRLHVEFADAGPQVVHEPGLDVSAVDLPTRGFDAPHMYFGGVAAAARTRTGDLTGASDPRRSGGVSLG